MDAEGNIYRTIKIGDQVWMAENLKVAGAGKGQLERGAFIEQHVDSGGPARLRAHGAVAHEATTIPWRGPLDSRKVSGRRDCFGGRSVLSICR